MLDGDNVGDLYSLPSQFQTFQCLKAKDLEQSRNYDVLLLSFFIAWAAYTILFHLFGLYKSVEVIYKQKREEYVDRYVVWEFYVTIAFCIWKIAAVGISIAGKSLYGYEMIAFSTSYGCLMIFEFLNLSKIYNLIRIARFIERKQKLKQLDTNVTTEKLINFRIRFERWTRVLFGAFVIMLMVFWITFVTLQIVYNWGFEPKKDEKNLILESNWKLYRNLVFVFGGIFIIIGTLAILTRLVLLIFLLRTMKRILHFHYKGRKIATILTVLSAIILIICLIFIVNSREIVTIRELYIFGADYQWCYPDPSTLCQLTCIILGAFVWPIPSDCLLLLVIMFNIYSVYYK